MPNIQISFYCECGGDIMVEVEVVKYLDDENTEAIVKLTSGKISLLAYDYPHIDPINKCDCYLSCFLANNIRTVECFRAPIQPNPGTFDYCLVAEVINPEKRLVQIGDIKIFIDIPLPKDILVGRFIEFDVVRLDYNA